MKRGKSPKVLRTRLALLGSWVLIGGLFLIVGLLGVFIYFAKDLPSPEAVATQVIAQSTKIYDRSGTVLLYDLYGEQKRTLIAIEELPEYVVEATLAAEDDDFYNHFGVDFKAILRAAWANIRQRSVAQGGSTISQQLIKNSLLSKERTFSRKIKEVLLAIELEFRYSKQEILEMYFNQIAYGSNAYGIEAASNTYFNKSARDLTLAEAATLASLLKAPTFYSPFGPNRELLLKRKDAILSRMTELGLITQEEAGAAQKAQLQFAKNVQFIKAPHFVFYVLDYLHSKYDEGFVARAGWKVTTTLDFELQKKAEAIIEEGAKTNEQLYGAANASLVAIDPKTGQVLSMVGSRDYFETESKPLGCTPGLNCAFEPQVNVALRARSPGSAFKPFAYSTAFKKGYSDKALVYDVFTEFNPNCPADGAGLKDEFGFDCYHPGNYDDRFRGVVSFREAMAQSLNVPSVKVLYLAGVEDTILTAEDFGISTLKDRSRFGLSLVLGGGEVKLLELTAAYGALAQEGILHKTAPVLRIEDAAGIVAEEFRDESQRVLDAQIARLVTDILTDNAARTPIFGARSPLYFSDRPMAAKTGTTQFYNDAWTVGYTPSLAVGVWAGNNDNRPMTKEGAGIAAAGPLWHTFIEEVLKDKPIEEFVKPEIIEPPPRPLLGGFVENPQEAGGVHSILFYVNKDNPLGPQGNPNFDSQFKNWELAIQRWFLEQPVKTPGQERKPLILINSPIPLQQVGGDFLEIKTSTTSFYPLAQVDFFLDELPIGVDALAPYELTYRLTPLISNGSHRIKVRVYDQVNNQAEAQVEITINR